MTKKAKKQLTRPERIALIKKEAPPIPPITCPYIDRIIEMMDDYNEREMTNADKSRNDLIIASLEYIRTSNDELRISSKYWYNKFIENVR